MFHVEQSEFSASGSMGGGGSDCREVKHSGKEPPPPEETLKFQLNFYAEVNFYADYKRTL